MCKWKQYFLPQLKRVIKALPGICLLTVVLTVSLLVLLKAMLFVDNNKEEKQIVQVGIVGDLSDSYLGMGINVIKNMDGVKSMVEIDSMTQEEAMEQFAAGEISAVLLVPDGFVDSILTGENKQITYITSEEAAGLGGLLVNEVVSAISGMVTTTQSCVYAMQMYLLENDKREYVAEATRGVNEAYIAAVLNRMDIYELQLLGVSNKISTMGHLFSGILLLLMMLWGIHCVCLMVREEDSLLRILHVKGLRSEKQVLAEVAAYSILQCFSLFCVFGCLLLLKDVLGLSVREWDILETGDKLGFICGLIPVVLTISTMQAFLYELVTNVVNGVLLQFVVAVSMAYISGCIYPLSFFPKMVQHVAAYSPAGVALRYMQKGLTQQSVWSELLVLVLYSVVFIGLHIIRRKCRITKD